MLVLSRKKGETIMIGDDIELIIVDVTSDGVRLGIKAPKEVTILRKEIFTAIAETNQDAALPDLGLEIIQKQIKNLMK